MAAELRIVSSPTRLPRRRRHVTGAWLHRQRLRAGLLLIDMGPRIRRAIDVVASVVALLVLAPVLLVCAVGIKLTSAGPVLFRQQRVGRYGSSFVLYKLRTMRKDADAQKIALWRRAHAGLTGGIRFKLRDDPRVTRLGHVLRKYSLDEVPQLLNVLRGDMTLIGPRPALWSEVRLHDPRALRRLEVTPGLTCLWQISGRSDLSFSQQVELDLEYIDRHSVLREVSILLKTIPAVISGRGAY